MKGKDEITWEDMWKGEMRWNERVNEDEMEPLKECEGEKVIKDRSRKERKRLDYKRINKGEIERLKASKRKKGKTEKRWEEKGNEMKGWIKVRKLKWKNLLTPFCPHFPSLSPLFFPSSSSQAILNSGLLYFPAKHFSKIPTEVKWQEVEVMSWKTLRTLHWSSLPRPLPSLLPPIPGPPPLSLSPSLSPLFLFPLYIGSPPFSPLPCLCVLSSPRLFLSVNYLYLIT